MNTYILTTKRLGLREWLDSDIDPFSVMNLNSEVMKYYTKTLSFSETYDFVSRIKLSFEKYNFGLFAVEEKMTKTFIGYTGFSIPTFDTYFTPCIEIGWRFRKEFWKKGLATEAAQACLNYGFDVLKFDKIVSFTSILNIDSENVMKRIGMKLQGYFDHPKIDKSNPLCRHVLYEIESPNR